MRVIINRFFYDSKQTLGSLLAINSQGKSFVCKTLELAWKNNESNKSCIPEGVYKVKWTRSNRLSREAGHDVFTYEILGVDGRAGIRIHSANYFFQVLGCIAFGDAHKDINLDQNLDVIHSGKTVNYFAEFMNYQDFDLEIKRAA